MKIPRCLFQIICTFVTLFCLTSLPGLAEEKPAGEKQVTVTATLNKDVYHPCETAKDTLKITVSQDESNTNTISELDVTIQITEGEAWIQDKKDFIRRITKKIAVGKESLFTIRTGSSKVDPVIEIKVDNQNSSIDLKNPKLTMKVQLKPFKLTAKLLKDIYLPHERSEDTLKVSLTRNVEQNGNAASSSTNNTKEDVDVTIKIVEGDARIEDKKDLINKITKKIEVGKDVHFTLKTGSAKVDPIIVFDVGEQALAVDLENPRLTMKMRTYQGTFMSDSTVSDVILGVTFQNRYDKEGKNEGFKDQRLLGQLNIDTLWSPRRKKNGTTKRLPFDIHSKFDVRFSNFPVEKTPENGDNGEKKDSSEKFSDYADSLTGTVSLIIQPKRLSYYRESSQDKDLPVDANRFGIILRAGITTLEEVTDVECGDRANGQFGAGFRFTHHHTDKVTFLEDMVNRSPIRYIDVSYVWYEYYASMEKKWRWVLESAFTIPSLGSETFPFYAGIYANFGKGRDDIRVFVAKVFKLDRIAKLFSK